jgi:Skp family chaperone for outer membrane proteins
MEIFISFLLTILVVLTYDYIRVYRILTQSIQKEFDSMEAEFTKRCEELGKRSDNIKSELKKFV